MTLFAKVNSDLSPLTKKENQVFSMLAEGLTQREMSDRLHRSFATISTHIVNIKDKLDANNSTHAVSIGFAKGFLRYSHSMVLAMSSKPGNNAASSSDVYPSKHADEVLVERRFTQSQVNDDPLGCRQLQIRFNQRNSGVQ